MKKHLMLVLLTTLAPMLSVAANEDDLTEKFFSKQNPTLTPQEKAALSISKRWTTDTTKPMPGANGVIRYVYGVHRPSIVCAVLQVCDVALQPGEQVNSIQLGDTARWSVEPAISGSGAGEIQHLIIKPIDVGLETSLVVTTDRRAYHFRLRSHRMEYMPQVSFVYPEDAEAKWDAIRARETKERQEKTIQATNEYLGDLNFEYDIEGSAGWKPVRVYHDSRKTVIEMPGVMQQTEAPTLLVVRKEGGIFTDEETVLVNYRVQNNRYIVDAVFDQAILVAGVGNNQDRVTITRRR